MKHVTRLIIACLMVWGFGANVQAQTAHPHTAKAPAAISPLTSAPKPTPPPTPAKLAEMYFDAWFQVGERYVDPSKLAQWGDWAHKYDGKLKNEQDLDAALAAMSGSLGDTWTGYESSHQKLLEAFASVRGLVDLGMVLKADFEGNYHVKIAPFGSIARENGLASGDEIKAINGKSLHGLTAAAVDELLQVPVTSNVTVTYSLPASGDQTISFKAIPSTAPLAEAKMLDNGVLYGRLSSFGDGPQDMGVFNSAVSSLLGTCNCNPRGMIFDLRGNPGGKFDLVLKEAAFFLPGKVVVTSTTREGNLQTSSTYRAAPLTAFESAGLSPSQRKMLELFSTKPIVVLVDASTASAAEVMTGALKDNGRALVVGVRTFGKGVGFDEVDVPLGGELTITTLKYMTPSGFDVSAGGITPDVLVRQSRDKSAADLQLAEGLKELEKRIQEQTGR
jgi:C-terminal peptidase prc